MMGRVSGKRVSVTLMCRVRVRGVRVTLRGRGRGKRVAWRVTAGWLRGSY